MTPPQVIVHTEMHRDKQCESTMTSNAALYRVRYTKLAPLDMILTGSRNVCRINHCWIEPHAKRFSDTRLIQASSVRPSKRKSRREMGLENERGSNAPTKWTVQTGSLSVILRMKISFLYFNANTVVSSDQSRRAGCLHVRPCSGQPVKPELLQSSLAIALRSWRFSIQGHEHRCLLDLSNLAFN